MGIIDFAVALFYCHKGKSISSLRKLFVDTGVIYPCAAVSKRWIRKTQKNRKKLAFFLFLKSF